MLRFRYILESLWSWFLETGIDLALILLIGLLVPRLGRLVMRVVRQRVESDPDEESGKNKLAFAGVGLYIVQIVAYLILIVAFLQQIGFSLAGVAIPATVASAAIGFGAQSIVADFLAGFFILTEKQFGVGDWVRFEGSGVVVEGTVVEVTMRATTIRTISQQTVIIPNSAAKICINHSKEWSRAVVSIPVPMLGSENINEVIKRSEDATRRALKQSEVKAVVIGELDVHPAVDVQPPTVVGMPWLVTMRFMVQVTAGNQWLVERAVRTRIIDEFWNEYGSATTTSGTFVDKLALDEHPLDHPTEAFQAPDQPTKAYNRKPVFDVPVDSLPGTVADETPTISMGAGGAVTPETPSTHAFPSAEKATVTDGGDVEPTPEGTHPNRPDVSMSVPAADEPEDKEKSNLPGVFRTDSYAKSWQKVLSLGGRVRMSTSLLLFGLLALLLVKLFTIEPSEDWEISRSSNEETAVSTSTTPPAESEPTEEDLPTEATTPVTPTTAEPTDPTDPTAPGALTSQPTTAGTEPTDEDSPATVTSPTTQAPTTAPGTPQRQPTPTGVQPPAAPLQEPAGVGEGA